MIRDHAFEPWTFPTSGLTICIHLEGGGVCGKAEDEHEPMEETELTE